MKWTDDITNIEGDRIVVEEIAPAWDTLCPAEHNLQLKTYVMSVPCQVCREKVFRGLRCQRCDVKFHDRCRDQASKYCQPIILKDNLAKM